jgi:hypothetical protein
MKSSEVVPIVNKRTIVRIQLALLRAQFRLLARVAPGLSDRRAAALFGTPRRPGRPGEPATPGLVAERLTVPSGRFRLAAWAWGSGPTVVLAHGWNGHAAQLSEFIAPLVESGFRPVERPCAG